MVGDGVGVVVADGVAPVILVPPISPSDKNVLD